MRQEPAVPFERSPHSLPWEPPFPYKRADTHPEPSLPEPEDPYEPNPYE